MPHGSATVESGFSVNKALLIQSIQEKSVIALLTVHDAGGLLQLNVSKKMILAARKAHSYYELKKNLLRKNLSK